MNGSIKRVLEVMDENLTKTTRDNILYLVLLRVTISQWNDSQLPWRLDLKEFRGMVSFCIEWTYARFIKGRVLEEKQGGL